MSERKIPGFILSGWTYRVGTRTLTIRDPQRKAYRVPLQVIRDGSTNTNIRPSQVAYYVCAKVLAPEEVQALLDAALIKAQK